MLKICGGRLKFCCCELKICGGRPKICCWEPKIRGRRLEICCYELKICGVGERSAVVSWRSVGWIYAVLAKDLRGFNLYHQLKT